MNFRLKWVRRVWSGVYDFLRAAQEEFAKMGVTGEDFEKTVGDE